MAWKATGQPTVRKQRDKWVVRVDGIDTATGKHRPRQLGTYQSQRSANAAARSVRADERSVEPDKLSDAVLTLCEADGNTTAPLAEPLGQWLAERGLAPTPCGPQMWGPEITV